MIYSYWYTPVGDIANDLRDSAIDIGEQSRLQEHSEPWRTGPTQRGAASFSREDRNPECPAKPFHFIY